MSICDQIISELQMNKVRITHNDKEYSDLNYLFNLIKTDLKEGVQIDLLDEPATIIIGFSNHHKIKKKLIREDSLHVHGVTSESKGAGKKLLYLITCLAKKLELPISFEAQPGGTATFSPNTPEEQIKLLGKAGYSTAPTYATMLMPLIEAARDISKLGKIV